MVADPRTGAGPEYAGEPMARVIVHLVDGTYELFRYFPSRRPRPSTGARRRGAAGGARRGRDPCSACSRAAPRIWAWPPTTSSSPSATRSGRATRRARASTRCCTRQFQPLEEALARARRGRLAHGRVRGRRCAGRGGGHGRGRCACRAGRRLHAGQGPGAVRARRPDRAARSAHARVPQRGRGAAESSVSSPASIPDWLALVGDSADGYPGLPGWGAKSAAIGARPLSSTSSSIPPLATEWDDLGARRAATGDDAHGAAQSAALLFRQLARLRLDAPIGADVDCAALGRTARRLRDLGRASRRPATLRARRDTGHPALRVAERRAESLVPWPPSSQPGVRVRERAAGS